MEPHKADDFTSAPGTAIFPTGAAATATTDANGIMGTAPEPTAAGQSQRAIHGICVTPALAQEIEQALEMMRRVRTADLAQGKGEAVEPPLTRYLVPEPLVYPASGSSDGE